MEQGPALPESVDARAEAGRAAEYLIEWARKIAGVRYRQGAWRPALPCDSSDRAVRFISQERIYRLPREAAQALITWAEGHPVELHTSMPSAGRVLALQARGARCVSLLPHSLPSAPHENGFAFAIHDLCHLGKFVCSEHYPEQVGFFATLNAVFETEAWRRLEGELDDQWKADRDHVAADMNGSAVFLFAAFKMKLKMAVRRLVARRTGLTAPDRGGLSESERAVFDEIFEHVLDAFDVRGALRDAAVATSARRDCPRAATLLVEYFRERGRAAAERARSGALHGGECQ